MPMSPPEFQRYTNPATPKYIILPAEKKPDMLQALFMVCWYALVFVGSVFFLVAFFYANGPKLGRWCEVLFNWLANLLRI
jgi:hypothetical protein